MKAKLVQQMQNYVAETCVGASAMRNQGGSGLVQAARKYFKTIDLASIPTDESRITDWLENHTDALLLKFPVGARKFGSARKALNLFVRSAAYNRCLNQAFQLDAMLPLLEVPLDSYAAKHLLRHNCAIASKWVGLKFVTRAEHGKYQLAALDLAKRWQVHRVDLDVFFFREEADAA
jgi:hypothetical protein